MSAPSVTVAPGVTITADMTPVERHNAIAQALGAPKIERPVVAPQWHTPATVARLAQGDAAAARVSGTAPRKEDGSAPATHQSAAPVKGEDGARVLTSIFDSKSAAEQRMFAASFDSADELLRAGGSLVRHADGTFTVYGPGEAVPQHAGMAAPTPQELAAQNGGNLEAFDAEMRALGVQKPLPDDPSRFQRDGRTGIVVDTAALERCHELFQSIPAGDREANRREYEATLTEIYAGRLGLADMQDGTGGQPRDAQGRYAPSPYTSEQWEAGHASATDANGYIPLERINSAGLSGYTLPRFVTDQTYHKNIFGELAAARAQGISQEQINGFIEAQMRRDGFIQ